MSDDGLSSLSGWYLSHCNSAWEHSYGVTIGALDNPGWSVKTKLIDTPLKRRTFERVAYGEPSTDLEEWRRTGSGWVAAVEDSVFEASCGPLDLSAVIDLFRRWVEQTAQSG